MKKVVKTVFEWSDKELKTFQMLSDFMKDFYGVCPDNHCLECPLGEFCDCSAEDIKESLETFLEENQ